MVERKWLVVRAQCRVLAEQERLRSIYTERWSNPLAMANHLK